MVDVCSGCNASSRPGRDRQVTATTPTKNARETNREVSSARPSSALLGQIASSGHRAYTCCEFTWRNKVGAARNPSGKFLHGIGRRRA